MLFLKNAIDGFKLVIGSFVIHCVFILTMVIALRPPKYEDEERTNEALGIYIFLIFYHLALGGVRYWNLFLSNQFRANITIWMMLTVVVIILLCQRWIYIDLEVLVLETKNQREWYVWCWIELAFFYSTIIGAAILTFIRSWFPIALRIEPPLLVADNEHVDFLDVESLTIDLFNMIAAPFIISIMIGTHCYVNLSGDLYTMSSYQNASNWLSFVQMILFCIGMFTPRCSVFRSISWNENMPRLCMFALQISMFAIPPTIIVLSIITLVIDGMQVSQMLFLWLQVGTLLWYGLDLYPALVFHHE